MLLIGFIIDKQFKKPKHDFRVVSESLSSWSYILKVTVSGRIEQQTDLVDDGEDGVDEHQVVLLDRQVVGLLQSKHHRSDQGDLGGAEKTKREGMR